MMLSHASLGSARRTSSAAVVADRGAALRCPDGRRPCRRCAAAPGGVRRRAGSRWPTPVTASARWTCRSTRPVSARRGGAYRSDVVRTAGFTMLGLTWDGGSERARARVRTDGTWGAWQPLELLADGPDRACREGNGRSGTDLLWVGRAGAAQVEVAGGRPDGLTLTLLDTDRAVDDRARPRHTGPPPAPTTTGAPLARHVGRRRVAAVGRADVQPHDPAGARAPHGQQQRLPKADVPGLLRGIYRYHTQNLGWSDIGYNFLVDRFGRTWVGPRRWGEARCAARTRSGSTRPRPASR